MRAHWMRLAALVTVLSLIAGCTSAPPAPTSVPPTQPPATQAPPTQAPQPAAPTFQPTPASASTGPVMPSGSVVNALWGNSASDVFAVGWDGDCCALILHYDGSAWSAMSKGTGPFLQGVWGSSGSDVFAVGADGTILHYDGSVWSPMQSGTSRMLISLWGSSGRDVFAVGETGTILHYDGKAWSSMESGWPAKPMTHPSRPGIGTSLYLLGVWGASDHDVFASGDFGAILHYDGKTWSPMNSGTTVDLNCLWGTSGSDIFAYGDNGTILHYDGHAWSPMNSGTTDNLNTMWGSSDSDVFAAGDNGAIVHFDGHAWSPMQSGTTQTIYTVWGSSGSDVFAVGEKGTILHYDGKAWAPMSNSAPVAAASAAPAADLPAPVKAFEEAYNRHDVDATIGLFGRGACIALGFGPLCRFAGLEDLLRYDTALNSMLEFSDCSVEGDRVTCRAAQRNDCLAAAGVGETHYASVIFTFQDGKIARLDATKTPEDAQRDLLFLYTLAGWAHRTRPAEWDKVGRNDLLDDRYLPSVGNTTGAAMSALCKEYAAGAAAAPTPSPAPAPPRTPPAVSPPGRVLFIGDSSSLGLDGLLPKLAASAQPSVTVASKLNWWPGIAFGGQFELGTAVEDIRQGKWDAVVLQDDLNMDWPGRAGEFTEYGRKLDQAIKEAGAETVFYMVYPYRDSKETTTQGIDAAYSKIGKDLGDKVAPVALAFQRALKERHDLNLYAEDGEHPSWAGIYLEACVLFAILFGRSPVGLTYRMQGTAPGDWQLSPGLEREALMYLDGANWEISEKDAADLQRIAWETVQDYRAGH